MRTQISGSVMARLLPQRWLRPARNQDQGPLSGCCCDAYSRPMPRTWKARLLVGFLFVLAVVGVIFALDTEGPGGSFKCSAESPC